MSKFFLLVILIIFILAALFFVHRQQRLGLLKRFTGNQALPTVSDILPKVASSLDLLSSDGAKIIDSTGRQVILRGFVTVTNNTDGSPLNYTLADYQRMRSMGANYQSIRIGASAVGAWPGTSADESYIARLDSMIKLAKQAGIYSDLKLTVYDVKGIRVLRGWDKLWLNQNKEQDKVIAGWEKLWQRYRDEPAVIGYDLLNEPMKGNLNVSDDEFVTKYLNPFYQKAIDSLRRLDQKHLALFQPLIGAPPYQAKINRSGVVFAPHYYPNIINYLRSSDLSTAEYQPLMARLAEEAKTNNAPLMLGEYGNPWLLSKNRDKTAEKNHQNLEKLTSSLIDQYALSVSRPHFADERACWSLDNKNYFCGAVILGKQGLGGEERKYVTDVFVRVYPQKIAGKLNSSSYNFDNDRFSMQYTSGTAKGQTQIYIPQTRHFPNGFTVKHSAGITLVFDPSQKTLKAVDNTGNINAGNFSWDDDNQVLTVKEWQDQEVTVEIYPSSPAEVKAVLSADSNSLVKNTTVLVNKNAGRVDWSVKDVIAFGKLGSDGYSDIYTMSPDKTRQVCLTCNKGGVPQLSNDQPAWNPIGTYLVFQAQDPNLSVPLALKAQEKNLTQGGSGYNNNLWAVTADGSKFYQLTHIKSQEASLHPHFSHDGKKLLWAGRALQNGSNGQWALHLADFVVDNSGARLTNEKTFQPLGSKTFYESHGFTINDTSLIFSASKTTPLDLDIYTYNLATGQLKNLTNSPGEWDEHSILSPSGKKLVWISSKGYDFKPDANWSKTLKTDYWLMNTDGSDKVKLTHFNEPGFSEYAGGARVITADITWNRGGDQLAAVQAVISAQGSSSKIVLIRLTNPQ